MYKRYSIVLCSFIIFFTIGFAIYRTIEKKRNVLGASMVTKLNKNDYIFPSVGSFKLFYEPTQGIQTDKPEWLPYTATYTINKDLLNERYDYSVQKPVGTYRIMAIGDSFTFGHYVNTNQNYPEQLEDLLNTTATCRAETHFDVINLGVPGYDVGYTVQRFISRGKKYSPDLVIWFINPHNLLQLRDIITVQEKAIQDSLTATEEAKYRSEGEYYFAANEAMRQFENKYERSYILKKQFEYLDAFSKEYSGPLLIITSPLMKDDDLLAKIHKFVSERPATWEYLGLPILEDIHGTLPDSHPNAYGYSVIASHIDDYVKTLSVYPCK